MNLEEVSNRERVKTLDTFRPPPIEISQGPQHIANDKNSNHASNNVKNIASAANSDSSNLEEKQLTEKLLKKRSKVKFYKEFEFYLKLLPKSTHGRMILFWDRIIEDYNDRDVYYYKPPNCQLSDVKTVLKDLKSKVKKYDPKSINSILCVLASVMFMIALTTICIVLFLTVDIREQMIYIIPIYLVIFFLTIIISWYISNKVTQGSYVKRFVGIQERLDVWNKEKFLELGLEWKVGGLGAWLEITHDIRDYGVYVNYCDERGFTADSDAMRSPTKMSETPTIHRYPDSWICTNPITPRLQITPSQTNAVNSQRHQPNFNFVRRADQQQSEGPSLDSNASIVFEKRNQPNFVGKPGQEQSEGPSLDGDATIVFENQQTQLDKSIFNMP